MRLKAYTDGASRGNPGESGIGIVIKDEQDETIFAGGGYIGQATNNVAEYSALIACLKKVRSLSCTHLAVYSDSELLVRQMQGTYKVRDKKLQEYYQAVVRILDTAEFDVSFTHIDREDNRDADKLANQAIDSRLALRL